MKQSVDFFYDKMKEFIYLPSNEIKCNINTNKNCKFKSWISSGLIKS